MQECNVTPKGQAAISGQILALMTGANDHWVNEPTNVVPPF